MSEVVIASFTNTWAFSDIVLVLWNCVSCSFRMFSFSSCPPSLTPYIGLLMYKVSATAGRSTQGVWVQYAVCSAGSLSCCTLLLRSLPSAVCKLMSSAGQKSKWIVHKDLCCSSGCVLRLPWASCFSLLTRSLKKPQLMFRLIFWLIVDKNG